MKVACGWWRVSLVLPIYRRISLCPVQDKEVMIMIRCGGGIGIYINFHNFIIIFRWYNLYWIALVFHSPSAEKTHTRTRTHAHNHPWFPNIQHCSFFGWKWRIFYHRLTPLLGLHINFLLFVCSDIFARLHIALSPPSTKWSFGSGSVILWFMEFIYDFWV